MTDVEKVRLLIGDPAGAAQEFSDADIQVLLDLNDGSLYLACALACDSRASRISVNSQEVKIGDYSTSDRTRLSAIQAQAEKFRELEFETPAYGVATPNVSDFTELQLIRNYVLRTTP